MALDIPVAEVEDKTVTVTLTFPKETVRDLYLQFFKKYPHRLNTNGDRLIPEDQNEIADVIKYLIITAIDEGEGKPLPGRDNYDGRNIRTEVEIL